MQFSNIYIYLYICMYADHCTSKLDPYWEGLRQRCSCVGLRTDSIGVPCGPEVGMVPTSFSLLSFEKGFVFCQTCPESHCVKQEVPQNRSSKEREGEIETEEVSSNYLQILGKCSLNYLILKPEIFQIYPKKNNINYVKLNFISAFYPFRQAKASSIHILMNFLRRKCATLGSPISQGHTGTDNISTCFQLKEPLQGKAKLYKCTF